MAKSARSSVRKRNNATLRAKIFGPAVDARTERLSAKLQELINKPKPEEEKAMDVDEQKEDDSTKDATSTGIEGQNALDCFHTRSNYCARYRNASGHYT